MFVANFVLCSVLVKMVRGTVRNDVSLATALGTLAQAMQNQNPPNAENARTRSLATFQRENPPVFKGK